MSKKTKPITKMVEIEPGRVLRMIKKGWYWEFEHDRPTTYAQAIDEVMDETIDENTKKWFLIAGVNVKHSALARKILKWALVTRRDWLIPQCKYAFNQLRAVGQ